MKCLFILVCLTLGSQAVSAAESLLFEDTFEREPTAPWTWLREQAEDWRIEGGGLEICVRPGDAQTVRNALVRAAPNRREGRYAVEVTVTNHQVPTEQYEQAGITWYSGGQPVFKLVKERVDGQLMIIPGRIPMTRATVQLRVVIDGNRWTAQFRPEARGDFQTAATGELPDPDNDQVSVQCYHGPEPTRHWIRFEDFRILRLED